LKGEWVSSERGAASEIGLSDKSRRGKELGTLRSNCGPSRLLKGVWRRSEGECEGGGEGNKNEELETKIPGRRDQKFTNWSKSCVWFAFGSHFA